MPPIQGIASGGALVKGITMKEFNALDFLEEGAAERAREAGFAEGRNGGDVIMMGAFLASDLRAASGRRGPADFHGDQCHALWRHAALKLYTVGGLFRTGSVELDRIYI